MEMMNRLATGERLVDLCVEYGISRKTGQKFKARYKELGIAALRIDREHPRSFRTKRRQSSWRSSSPSVNGIRPGAPRS